MNTTVSGAAAQALGFLAVATRLFVLLTVEYASAQNAAWISALLGLAAALPALWLMGATARDAAPAQMLRERSPGLLKAVCLLLLPLLILNAASGARYVFLSANYAALTDIGKWTLMVPLFLVLFYALFSGGRGITGSARLALASVPWLIGIVVLVQLRYYEPAWLTPLLGGGTGPVLSGAVRAAGTYMELFALWLISGPDGAAGGDGLRPLRTGTLAGIAAAALLLLHAMMAPAPVSAHSGMVSRLNAVLYNGRAPLVLHLPIMTVWMLCLLHQIAFSAVTAVGILGILLPRGRRVFRNAAVVLCSAAAALWGSSPAPGLMADVLGLWYPVAGIGAAALFARNRPKEA